MRPRIHGVGVGSTGALVALLVGCQFDGTGLSPSGDIDAAIIGGNPVDAQVDGDPRVIDASVDASVDANVDAAPRDDIIHVPASGERLGSGDLVLSGQVRIDTKTLEVGFALPTGVTFDVVAQDGAGPELAVLHVAKLDVSRDASVRVVGTRPLVIIAGGNATINGVIDAGARKTEPGAGGQGATLGSRRGSEGVHGNTTSVDSGGGGAGGATTGAVGGAALCNRGVCAIAGGKAGPVYSEDERLRLDGGAGGGAASRGGSCDLRIAGAGGGAIQIYSAISIAVTGAIGAGGGGGGGGNLCNGDAASGAGGGGGGMIFLQAPAITVSGTLAANGGGGGGAASVTDDKDGGDGGDGARSVTPAPGGAAGGPNAGAGGAGAGGGGPAVVGQARLDAGGGGGASGLIVARGKTTPSTTGATLSPRADLGTY